MVLDETQLPAPEAGRFSRPWDIQKTPGEAAGLRREAC